MGLIAPQLGNQKQAKPHNGTKHTRLQNVPEGRMQGQLNTNAQQTEGNCLLSQFSSALIAIIAQSTEDTMNAYSAPNNNSHALATTKHESEGTVNSSHSMGAAFTTDNLSVQKLTTFTFSFLDYDRSSPCSAKQPHRRWKGQPAAAKQPYRSREELSAAVK